MPDLQRQLIELFPAYAGVILSCDRPSAYNSTFPRIRGGDPEGTENIDRTLALFPAYAGVILAHRALQR